MSDDKFSGIGNVLAAMTTPKWALKQWHELEDKRAHLSLFCNTEQIKQIEAIAFENAVTRWTESNHVLVISALEFAYDGFSNGLEFDKVLENLRDWLKEETLLEEIRIATYGR